ncbi:MAG: AAA family ATPase [Rhodospirillaceae bacterium]|nr:AAA family ATPase [Rhodospirillaceae bacterium]
MTDRKTEDFSAAILDLDAWSRRPVPEREWAVEDLIPLGNVTMLSGIGGVGKTTLLLQLIVACATHGKWLGLPTRPARVVAVLCEDDERELVRRLTAVCRAEGLDLDDLMEHAEIHVRDKLDCVLVQFCPERPQGVLTDFGRYIVDRAADADLLILDPLHDLFAGNENDRVQARHFIKHVRTLCKTVVLASHPSRDGERSGSGVSGSTAWHAAVRSRLYLDFPASDGDKPANPDARILSTKKANYGPIRADIDLRWDRGVFVRHGPDFGTVAGIERRARERQMVEIIVKGVETWRQRGMALSASTNATNYAPKQVAKLQEANGFTWKQLRPGFDAAFNDGLIEIGDTGLRTGKRGIVSGIILTAKARETFQDIP